MRSTRPYKTSTVIALINGKQVQYDMADESLDVFDRNRFLDKNDYEYLGQGTIHSVDGIVQDTSKLLHFWNRKGE